MLKSVRGMPRFIFLAFLILLCSSWELFAGVFWCRSIFASLLLIHPALWGIGTFNIAACHFRVDLAHWNFILMNYTYILLVKAGKRQLQSGRKRPIKNSRRAKWAKVGWFWTHRHCHLSLVLCLQIKACAEISL